MNIEKIKPLLKPLYNKFFGALMAERTKEKLRRRITGTPITSRYPYDIELKVLRAVGFNPPVMLDIGAHNGIYSSVLEDMAGNGNLHIFEPLPHIHSYLKQNFKKAHIYKCALSDCEGRRKIRIPYIEGKRFDTRATFNDHSEPSQTGHVEVEVQINSLDNFSRTIPLHSIGFIKIDVEGHELQVIRGGAETISRYKPLILIEIESRHHEFPITRIFCELEKMGYKGYYVNPATFDLCDTAGFNCDIDQNLEHFKSRDFLKYLNNFFFVHEDFKDEFVFKILEFLKSEKLLAEEAAVTGVSL
jgi:FkbM family methyltransferase